MKIILIITICFAVFSVGMLAVYADSSQDVLDKRDEIKTIKEDIEKQEDIIAELNDEREHWQLRYDDALDDLKAKQKETKGAENDLQVAQRSVYDEEDLDEVERLKKVVKDLKAQEVTLENDFNNKKKDLDKYKDELDDARDELRALINRLPDAEELLDDLVIISNRDVPALLFGTQNGIKISIILSDTCLISEDCPNYFELAEVYDNSNRYISGEFEYVDTGKTKSIYEMIECEGNCSTEATLQKIEDVPIFVWERQAPKYAQYTVEWYEYNLIPVLTFVDPDDQTRQRSKIIYIEPSLLIGFELENQLSKSGNHTLSFGQDRRIYGCSSAIIGWNPIADITGDDLLADTWNYFYTNCSEPVIYSTGVSLYFEPSDFRDCHRYCQYLKWIADSKELAKQYLIGINLEDLLKIPEKITELIGNTTLNITDYVNITLNNSTKFNSTAINGTAFNSTAINSTAFCFFPCTELD